MTNVIATLRLGALLFACCALSAAADAAAPVDFRVWDEARLEAVQRSVRGDSPEYQPALDHLRREVEAAKQAPALSVTQKSRRGASGDARDYYSQAPYWWPDPAKPDGLPFIWRDGQVNPASRDSTDSEPFKVTADRIEVLALAWRLWQDERAAARAIHLIDVWFLDETTGMRPHLEFAQEIPGVRPGSGIGIIALRRIILVLDAVRALRTHPEWTAEREEAFRGWVGRYFDWLRHSGHGRLADEQANNHGTYYDLQYVQLALFLGEEGLARERLLTSGQQRLPQHIDAQGRQPHEAHRTRGLYYSFVNLTGWGLLARSAGELGLAGWQEPRLDAALDYLVQFVDPRQVWPHADIDAWPRATLVSLLVLPPPGRLDPPQVRLLEDAARSVRDRWVLTGVPSI